MQLQTRCLDETEIGCSTQTEALNRNNWINQPTFSLSPPQSLCVILQCQPRPASLSSSSN